jgi:hypothetical protein
MIKSTLNAESKKPKPIQKQLQINCSQTTQTASKPPLNPILDLVDSSSNPHQPSPSSAAPAKIQQKQPNKNPYHPSSSLFPKSQISNHLSLSPTSSNTPPPNRRPPS